MDIAIAKANKVGVAWINCVGEFLPLLQKLNIYITKLPVQGQTIMEWLATMLKKQPTKE